MSKAVFGGGCFWCMEAVFSIINGVRCVRCGYSGGQGENPSYEFVCSGKSGFAEVVEIDFDESVISYDELLDVFFASHDPTQLNRQGNDIGEQYRSVIFYFDESQKKSALKKIKKLKETLNVVTQLSEFKSFYPAEGYHQKYFYKNPLNPYSLFVIKPKVEKIKFQFQNLLKD